MRPVREDLVPGLADRDLRVVEPRVDGALEDQHDRRDRVRQPDVLEPAAGPAVDRHEAVDDRRHPEPREQRELEEVLRVAEVHVGRAQQDARAPPVRSNSASNASGSNGMYAHATSHWMSASTANSTRLCRKKCTSMLPTAASGRISRGNDDLLHEPGVPHDRGARAPRAPWRRGSTRAGPTAGRSGRRERPTRGSSRTRCRRRQVEQRVQQRPREARGCCSCT